MTTDIVTTQTAPPAVQAPGAIELTAIAADVLLARRQAVERVFTELMVEGVHYGPVPGVDGSVMIDKPGFELLAASFQLALDYQVTEYEDAGDRRYVSRCDVTHQVSGIHLGSGMGEASTAESKFAWRKASKAEYDAAPEDRRRTKSGAKRGGGTYSVLQVRELAQDKANTALKMANKRAASDAIQAVLGVRGMILQAPGAKGSASAPAAQPVGPEPVAELRRFAAARGLDDDHLLQIAKPLDYAGPLDDLSISQYGYIAWKLMAMPDAVDPVTGEVAGGADDDRDEEPPSHDAESARDMWAERGGSDDPQGELQ